MFNASIMLKKASLKLERDANRILAPLGLTLSQFRVIMVLLLHFGGEARLIDIEDALALTHPTALGIVDNLEREGFVTRVMNPNDKRSRLIRLTDKTCSMKSELYDAGDQIEEMLCAPLSKSERKEFVSILEKIIDATAIQSQR